MNKDFDLRKFLTESRLTDVSRRVAINEDSTSTSLPTELVKEIVDLLRSWTVASLLETTNHFIEILTGEILPEFGIEVPEGMITRQLDRRVIKVAKQYEAGELGDTEVAQKMVQLMQDTINWTSRDNLTHPWDKE